MASASEVFECTQLHLAYFAYFTVIGRAVRRRGQHVFGKVRTHSQFRGIPFAWPVAIAAKETPTIKFQKTPARDHDTKPKDLWCGSVHTITDVLVIIGFQG